MRLFSEFKCKFQNDTVIGNDDFAWGDMTIDLMSVIVFNESDDGYTTVYMNFGDSFTLKVKYETFKKMMFKAGVLRLNSQS